MNGQINPNEHKLNENGYLYVPDKCANTSTPCHVHVHFHGCDLSSVTIKDLYVRKTGILEFAASNDIITIFPQVKDSSEESVRLGDWKENNCWTGGLELSYETPQTLSVLSMVN